MPNQNIVFIDQAVIDYQSLIAGVKSGNSVVLLDSTQDGVEQITEALQGGKYQSVQIISHGSEASLQLGATQLNGDNLGAYTRQLQQWASALTDNADILLYGCNVAAGEKGEAFIQQLSQVTGADIAASNNLTGNADLGGDWNLEVRTGKIESSLAFDTETLSKYKSVLPIGPDASGYIAVSTTFNPNLNLVPGDPGVVTLSTLSSVDDVTQTIDLGTNTFRFYGINYTGNAQLFASSNALITFGSGNTAYTNDGLTTTLAQAAIAVAWDDWITSVNTVPDDLVLYKFNDINSDGINDQLVIEWNNVHHISNSTSGDATYQAILDLNTGTQDGNIILNYTDLSIPNTPVDEAGSATVGIKAAGSQGSNRLLISQDTTASPYVGTGRAILITRSVPLLDLNGDQSSSASGIDYRTSFAQGVGAVSIVDSFNLSLVDPDSPTLASATITITNRPDGAAEVLATTTAGTNITASYNSTTGILSLTGSDTVANYQQVLRSITYNNTAASPNSANRIITFAVSDGTYTSPVATTTLGINAPVLDLNGAANGFNYTAYFPGGTPVSIVDSTNLTLIDPDNSTLASATATITNLRNGASEVLAANTTGTSISASYNSTTGVLSLTGSDTVANYQQVLRSVSYNNTAASRDTRDRLINFTVSDGSNNSPLAVTTIRNGNSPQPPVLDLNGPGLGINYNANFTENAGAIAIVDNTNLTLTDADSSNFTSATVTITNLLDGISEVLAANTTGTNIAATYNLGTGVLNLTGTDTVAHYQQVLRSITYNNTSDTLDTTNRIISFQVSDGTINSSLATSTLTITPVNPVLVSFGAATYNTTEGSIATNVTIAVTLDATPGTNVIVPIVINNISTATSGSDYTFSPASLTFSAGATGSNLTQLVTFTIQPDDLPENTETVVLNFGTLTGAVAGAITETTLNIAANDDVVTSAPTLINEIFFIPPGGDNPKEYIELRGEAGATLAQGTYLVGIEGDSGAPNPGNVQDIFDLSGKQFGSNGLLVLLQKGSTYVAKPGANVITNTGTGAGWGNGASSSIGHTGLKTDIESGSVSFLLIETSTAPTLTNDIDSNNDGTTDGAAYSSWTVLDSVSVLDGGAIDKAYGSIVFKKGSGGSVPTNATVVNTSFIPGYVGRSGDTTGSTASDWVASIITGTAPNLILGTVANTSDANFALQPLNHIGGTNFAPPADVNYAISTSTASVDEGNSGSKTVSFTVTRSGNTAIVTTVDYAFDGTATFNKDYNAIKVAGVAGGLFGALKFAAGETTKIISLNVTADKLNEVDERINLNLSYPDKTAAIIAPGTITIVDDDNAPTISIADKTGSEDSGNLVFTVKLSSVSSKTITVDYNTSNDTAIAGSDYTAVTNTLTFNPGVTTQTISIPILNDFAIESKESFFVNLVNPTNSTIADNKGIGTITDEDQAGFAISAVKGLVTNEAGGTDSFDIQLTTQPTADVTLNLSSSKVSEGTVSVPSVTFTTANWNTPQTITVTGVDDGVLDDNIAYQIITAKAVSTDTKYNNLNPADLDVINIKNGNQVNSIITGSALADTSLQGTSSDDLIFGFAGNDVIVGGLGNDRIYGGLGADNLTGGAGSDIFVLAKGEGKDTIKDFNNSEDLIALSGGLIYSGLSFTQSGNDTLIKVTANNESLALLTGITASTLNASNFITVGSPL